MNMSTIERIAFAFVLFVGGVAAGMYYEHQRFIREVQGLHKKHTDDPTAPGPSTPAPTPEAAA